MISTTINNMLSLQAADFNVNASVFSAYQRGKKLTFTNGRSSFTVARGDHGIRDIRQHAFYFFLFEGDNAPLTIISE